MAQSLVSLLLLSLAAVVTANKGQPKPIDLTVKAFGTNRTLVVSLSYNISGVVSSPPPCRNVSDDKCLPVLASKQNRADSDAVIIAWSYNTTTLPTPPANLKGIEIRVCFSNRAFALRAWRQDRFVTNPSISKTCKFVVTKDKLLNASAGNGTVTWKLPNNVPVSQLYVRAYTVVGTDADGHKVYAGYGQSPGFFATTSWDTVPSWLIAVTVPLMCVGPSIFVAYIIVKIVMDRRNK